MSAPAKPWIIRPAVVPTPELVAVAGGDALVAQLLAQRGLATPAAAIPFLDPAHYTPAPPTALFGVEHAALVLHTAIAGGQNFLVWGDFDVDGQTSTALLVSALQDLAGEAHVRFHVPNRFTESHGIRVPVLQEVLATSDIPIHLLVTCDTGIAETAGVGYAKDQGLTVVITDHHDLGAEFAGLTPGVDAIWGLTPPAVPAASVRRADAVVNPKFAPPADPLRTLPGVGVAYKLVQQLYDLAGRAGEDETLLDLVALGIVADVAEQVHDARYLLQRGLEKLRTTRRTGLLALMNNARIDPATLSADSIGYQLGPRMNALGRLEDATIAVELLSTRDALRAGELAGKLERLNQERQRIQRDITQMAFEQIADDPKLLDYNAIVLAHPNWHAGVVGIVAAKVAEEYGKPAILLLTPPGEAARGSARSAPGVDIGAAIAACSHLLLTHGGHPGAAGVSLLPENIGAFRRELSRQVETHRDADVEPGLLIDAALLLAALNIELVDALRQLAPFGQGNPTPQFVTYGLQVAADQRMGREGQHRKLFVQAVEAGERAPRLPVVWFGGGDAELPASPLDIVYTLNINEYRGERTLQLMYVDARRALVHEPAHPGTPGLATARVVYDLRGAVADLAQVLVQLPSPQAATWYAEGGRLENNAPGVAYAPRTAVTPAPDRPLVIWSAPPSPELLRWLVTTSAAQAIYLVTQPAHDDGWHAVLRQVAAMCKYALSHDGAIDVGRMAARLGITEAVIRHSLLWQAASGLIQVFEWLDGDRALIGAGSGVADAAQVIALQDELEALLAEVRAYRQFVRRARVESLEIG
jgi:single-stranded-DNA-specific exonuclease